MPPRRSPPSDGSSSTGPDSFTNAHRRSIGNALKLFEELIRGLRADGVEEESLATLEAAVAEIAEVTGAERPRPPRSDLDARLAQMLLYAMELDSRHLRAYGALSDDAAAYLDAQSRRLSDLTKLLIDRTSRHPRA